MVQISSFLSSLAILQLITAAPLFISEDGTSASLNGRSIDLQNAFKRSKSCESDMPKAIYFITNAANNSVVALKVGANGTLSDGSITPTGGSGLVGVEDGEPAAADGLFSQGSVRQEGNILIVVNPGSNTVSMFSISSNDPTDLTMIGQPASTMGDFPMSVTISSKLKQACVANSGATSGVSCLNITSTGLVPLGSLRPMPLGQTTPPSGPFNTIAETFFNPDQTALLTTVKGDPTVNNTGFLSAFPVVDGAVSTEETRSSPPGTAVLFGTAALPGSNTKFLTADASFGAFTMDISQNLTGSVVNEAKIEGQSATCWSTFSSVTGTGFVTDVGVNRLVEIDSTGNGGIVQEYEPQNGNLGMVDIAVKGNFMYALAPGNDTAGRIATVSVWDVSGGKGAVKEIQNFAPSGVTSSVQGMALY